MDTHWRQRAACVGVDPDLFFPEDGKHSRRAKEICGACPVYAECHDFIGQIEGSEGRIDGVYAGLTRRNRVAKMPIKGVERTHCRNEHEYAVHGVKEVARDGNEHWRCLECKRETNAAEYQRRAG